MTVKELKKILEKCDDSQDILVINPKTSHFTRDFGFTVGMLTDDLYLEIFDGECMS